LSLADFRMVSGEFVHYFTHSIRPRSLEHPNRLGYVRISGSISVSMGVSISVCMSVSIDVDDSRVGSKSMSAMMHMIFLGKQAVE
jgi:hypothetical protein